MIVVFGILTGLFFAAAAVGWSLAVAGQRVHAAEVAALKKVGGWYEARTAELEQENALLAERIIALGGIKPAVAMPASPPDEGYEYAFDDTGLVMERLDPRDMPRIG